MRRAIAVLALPLACLALAGCDKDPEVAEDAAEEGNVSGEVLEGTISDDMLPLDELRSAAPPAEVVPEAGASGAASSSSPAEQAGAAPAEPAAQAEAPAEPAPAAAAETPEDN